MEDPRHGVVSSAMEIVEIAETARLLAEGGGPFSEGERRYAAGTSDPERRLAARLAAKRAAVRALGGGLDASDIEVRRRRGFPPDLGLSARAEEQLRRIGGTHTRVSLTHSLTHAAAAVLVLASPAGGTA